MFAEKNIIIISDIIAEQALIHISLIALIDLMYIGFKRDKVQEKTINPNTQKVA